MFACLKPFIKDCLPCTETRIQINMCSSMNLFIFVSGLLKRRRKEGKRRKTTKKTMESLNQEENYKDKNFNILILLQ